MIEPTWAKSKRIDQEPWREQSVCCVLDVLHISFDDQHLPRYPSESTTNGGSWPQQGLALMARLPSAQPL